MKRLLLSILAIVCALSAYAEGGLGRGVGSKGEPVVIGYLKEGWSAFVESVEENMEAGDDSLRIAIKTNGLAVAGLIPNIGAEVYLGKNWSVSASWHHAWWHSDKALWYWRTYGGEIVGEQSYWREVVTPQPYRAWCTDQGLVEMSEEELEAYIEAPKVMFMELYGHIYKEPSFKAETICDLVGGDLMRLAGAETGKGKAAIKLRGRWTKVMLPSGRTGYVPTNELKVHEGFMSIAQGEGSADSISDETMEAIIAEAEKLIGVPYLWGGMSAKGVDCSGLVRISCIMNGILLPRNASQQIKCGDRVELDDLQRGDLVFFGTAATDEKPMRVTHVGIYLGNNRIIHSSHRVRINSLIPGDPDYYENAHRLIAAVRL